MIIDITKSGYRKGYLPKTGIGVFHPFFPTANAAFRREALIKTGGFDIHCNTGEDIDLSIRVAKAGYELWFEPSAKITHFHRYTLKALLKQWFHYGYGHAYLFKKHLNKPRMQFYKYNLSPQNKNIFGISKILDIPFPVHGMIFFTSYHFMHLFLFLSLVSLLFSSTQIGFILLAMFIFTAFWYFGMRFNIKTPLKSLQLSAIRYFADASYVLGGFLGGVKEKVIYIEAARSRRQVKS